jgi:hypothetical protein
MMTTHRNGNGGKLAASRECPRLRGRNTIERCAGAKQTIGGKDGNAGEVEKTTPIRRKW